MSTALLLFPFPSPFRPCRGRSRFVADLLCCVVVCSAISGLLKCISIDPYNLKALLMLGVSYTNDLEETRALKYLKTWMMNHPDYHGTALAGEKASAAAIAAGGASASAAGGGGAGSSAEEIYGGVASRLSLHDEVTKMFLDACRINPRDADLHTVLGVLFHISNDFDKAIDAFKTAVKLRPGMFQRVVWCMFVGV